MCDNEEINEIKEESKFLIWFLAEYSLQNKFGIKEIK